MICAATERHQFLVSITESSKRPIYPQLKSCGDFFSKFADSWTSDPL